MGRPVGCQFGSLGKGRGISDIYSSGMCFGDLYEYVTSGRYGRYIVRVWIEGQSAFRHVSNGLKVAKCVGFLVRNVPLCGNEASKSFKGSSEAADCVISQLRFATIGLPIGLFNG